MTMPEGLANKIWEGSGATQTHAIIACALGRDPMTTARFVGKATITSDGFIMCDFIDHDGQGRRGAFVGSWGELEANLIQLARLLGLTTQEHHQVVELVESWVGKDYR